MGFYTLSPSSPRRNKKRIYGFDVETYGKDNKFYCCAVYGDDLQRVFYGKKNFITLMKSGFFNDSIIVATNLGFDFFATFFNNPDGFNFIFRGSDLLYAKTYVYKKRFNFKSDRHKTSVTFLDTMNYAKLSVEKLGKLIGLPKMAKPKALGKRPKNETEKQELSTYNLRDAEVSFKALQFFYKSFEELGATPKLTLASTSMSLFKNRYLSDTYHRHDEDVLLELFEGYYGGRTEAFARGTFKNYNYYDYNSLYPSVMLNDFPDPNTLRTVKSDTTAYINEFEGASKVDIYCPYMDYPLLPTRANGKLLFPTGNLSGWYTHVELRQAIRLGYVIKKVYKTHYYTSKCSPFKAFVEDLYDKRLKYKSENSPMEKVVKILMNSLYGKFGQKFKDKDNLVAIDGTYEQLLKYPRFEMLGKKYLRVVEDRHPSAFCIPIWAMYVTAYGRLKLHDGMLLSKPIYVDTDSLICKSNMPTGKGLGELKLEAFVKTGTVVKPKFYMLNCDTFKVKGIGKKLVFNDFVKLLVDKEISYTKFIKIREGLRRGILPNTMIPIIKRLNLEDNKRYWRFDFNYRGLEYSRPLNLDEDLEISTRHDKTMPKSPVEISKS